MYPNQSTTYIHDVSSTQQKTKIYFPKRTMGYKPKQSYAQSVNDLGEQYLTNWAQKTNTLISKDRD